MCVSPINDKDLCMCNNYNIIFIFIHPSPFGPPILGLIFGPVVLVSLYNHFEIYVFIFRKIIMSLFAFFNV